VIIFIWMLV